MPIPDYQTLMLPLLRYFGDGQEHSLNKAVEAISGEYKLTPEERLRLLPSGTRTYIGESRIAARKFFARSQHASM